MKKELARWELSGFIITAGLGTLLHFVYEWTDNNKFAALFSAVNESTWEHLKLIFFPFALFSVIEYFIIGRQYRGYFTVKARGVILGMLSIVVLFYTYKGITGRDFMIADIIIFISGAAAASIYSYKFMNKAKTGNIFGISAFIILDIMFMVFTFCPPHIGLFLDPVSLTYGI